MTKAKKANKQVNNYKNIQVLVLIKLNIQVEYIKILLNSSFYVKQAVKFKKKEITKDGNYCLPKF